MYIIKLICELNDNTYWSLKNRNARVYNTINMTGLTAQLCDSSQVLLGCDAM